MLSPGKSIVRLKQFEQFQLRAIGYGLQLRHILDRAVIGLSVHRMLFDQKRPGHQRLVKQLHPCRFYRERIFKHNLEARFDGRPALHPGLCDRRQRRYEYALSVNK